MIRIKCHFISPYGLSYFSNDRDTLSQNLSAERCHTAEKFRKPLVLIKDCQWLCSVAEYGLESDLRLMSVAYINPEVLTWARERAGVLPEELMQVNRKYVDWEAGHALPTFRQAQELAKKLHVPFGFLYLSEPPVEKPPTVDLRTLNDSQHHEFSLELRDVVADARRKQDWYREYLLEGGTKPLGFVGKYSVAHSVDVVANDIEETLDLSLVDRAGFSKDTFLAYLTEHAEEVGILVLRNGKVGANTHRVLDVDEFRGFSLPDPIAPLVFVNTADFGAAQVFTLVHELAHLWMGAEGVSDQGISDYNSHSKIETFCNRVAVEVLVPKESFLQEWNKIRGTLEERTERLTRLFKVSSVVIARRALDEKLVNRTEFFAYYSDLREIWKNARRGGSGGGNFHNSLPVANSRTLTDAICHATYSGNLLMRDGARLLGIKPSTLSKYAETQGVL